MERFRVVIIAIVSILISQYSFSQCTQGAVTTFQKVYGGANNERAHSIQQTTDGGYVVAGETTSYGAGGKDIFVMKIDVNGIEQWSKTYGSTATDDGNSITIKQTNDLGYIISGYTESFGAGSFYDSYILKLDNSGNIQWEKRITGSSWDMFRDVTELSSGDFLLTGSGASNSAGNMDAHVVKISSTGNLVWIKNLGTTVREHSQSVIELPGGNYILSGNTNVTDMGNTVANAFLIKTDNNGVVLWSKEYGVNGTREDFNQTALLSDGNILSVGETQSYGVGNYDVWLVKTDTNGNVIWSKTYGGVSDDIGVNVKEKNNGELIISAFTGSYGNGKELLLINTDIVGNVIWSKTYGGSNNEELDWWGKPLELTSNNEIILVGGTTSFGVGNEDIYIIKANECGESFCNEQDIVLNVSSPNVLQNNFSVLSTTGGALVNTSSVVSSITFTDSYLCEDTITVSSMCNLITNFSNTTACLGDSTFFTDLSVDNVGNIIYWQWYFGDGDSLVGIQNSSHLYSSPGSYNVTLVVTNDSNCIDSITIPITVNPVFSSSQNVSICQGDSILIGGVFQNSPGTYPDSMQTIFGCDSIIINNLTVIPVFSSSQNVLICQGDSILIGGVFQNSPGSYPDSMQTIFGCDSIIISNLTINPIFTSSQNQTICQGDSVLFGGIIYNSSGNYTDSLQTVLGCDSLLTLNLTVDLSSQTNQTQTICTGDSILLGGSYQTASGVYTDSLQTGLGCDSIIRNTLFVNPIYNINQNQTICEGQSVLLGGSYQTNSGIYIDIFQSINGCDSVVTTSLTVSPTPNIVAYSDTTIEQGGIVQLSVFGGSSYIWSPDFDLSCTTCQNPFASPIVTTTYIVTGYDNGCFSSDTITVIVNKTEISLYIPNSFTPDFDGNNDIFYFYAYGFKEFEAQIFNRWGELLYESIDILNGWNAIYKGKNVPLGVYVYKIKVVSFDNQYFRKVGSINVIR